MNGNEYPSLLHLLHSLRTKVHVNTIDNNILLTMNKYVLLYNFRFLDSIRDIFREYAFTYMGNGHNRATLAQNKVHISNIVTLWNV